jgi:hypothetical protein
VAQYKLIVGRRIGSATLVADARHSWLDALSSAGALAGLVAVAAGQPWGDPVAGLAVTAFICHVGWEVTADVAYRLADGIDPGVITAVEAAAGSAPGVVHAHARARCTGRTLRGGRRLGRPRPDGPRRGRARPRHVHGSVVGRRPRRPSVPMPMMTSRPAFADSALWFLGDATASGMHTTTLTFTATTPGTYHYLCPVPGHAREGMTGTFTVASST